MPTVAISRPLPGSFDVPGADVRVGPERGFADRAALRAHVAGADTIVTWVSERIDGELLDAAGDGLRLVANYAVGYDNVDLEACRARGVRVSNTPDAVTEGTADCAVALMLAAARRIAAADQFCRTGAWAAHGILGPSEWIGQPLAGRTLLIVGAGRIGHATALRCLGFGMRTLYVARSRKPIFEHAPLCAERVDLDAGLARADVVSLHCPLTDETHHLIDARRLALLRPHAILVNTARGAVVDEAALDGALDGGAPFDAGHDDNGAAAAVHPTLRELDNVVLTPHFGSANIASRERMTTLCAANVRAVLAGGEPVTAVV